MAFSIDVSRSLRMYKEQLFDKHEQERVDALSRLGKQEAITQGILRQIDWLLDVPEAELRCLFTQYIVGNLYGHFEFLQSALAVIQRAARGDKDNKDDDTNDNDKPGSPSDSQDPEVERAKMEASAASVSSEQHAIKALILEAPDAEVRALFKVLLYSGKVAAGLTLHDLLCIRGTKVPVGVPFFKLLGMPAVPKPERASLVDDIHVCDQCDQVFLESENGETSCLYHTREVDLNDDSPAWEGWEDDKWKSGKNWVHNHTKYPGGFWYPCCQTTLENKTPGCKRARHWARDRDDGRGVHGWLDEEGARRPKAEAGGSDVSRPAPAFSSLAAISHIMLDGTVQENPSG
ncbi:hypothetical protein QBC39DRAFT_345639 [Podospora conica]|nr:hypothetical protein QBC39DRAFT_345639 [Schizothecium conicum]